jgi:hypothetical protein
LAVGTRLTAAYTFSIYYMIAGDYSKALTWMNSFLNHPRTNLRADLQTGMRLMNLVIHFELGNYDLIEYSIKSTYRFIYKQERMHQYERRFIRFFRDAIALHNATDLTDLMRVFQQDIMEIVKDPFERRALDVYSILVWLHSKLDGIPFKVAKRQEVDGILAAAHAKVKASSANQEVQ